MQLKWDSAKGPPFVVIHVSSMELQVGSLPSFHKRKKTKDNLQHLKP